MIEEANAKPMEDINRYFSVSSLFSQLLSFVSLGKPNFHMIFGHDSFKHKSTISPCHRNHFNGFFASVCKVVKNDINVLIQQLNYFISERWHIMLTTTNKTEMMNFLSILWFVNYQLFSIYNHSISFQYPPTRLHQYIVCNEHECIDALIMP